MSVTAERLMVEVQADVRQALRELDKVDANAGRSSSRMGKLARGIGGAFSGAAIVGGIGKTIQLAKDFDLTMRQVGVQTGTTGAGLSKLGDLAMKMGADTAFSAADAGQAMLELAKGGLKAADIQGGALKTTMTLAAAGNLDMASSAGYVTQAMNTFGLSAKNADQIATALAGGANASTASVESLGMALSQVGPGAANAQMSIQETVAALSAFDNAGIKGSDAGTSLKTMLTSLVPATDKAQGAMKKYGLEFTKRNGDFKSMAQVAQQLKNGLGDLSAEERTNALRTIFGSDATRAATVLMKEGKKGVEGYVKATKDQSTVQKMANTAMGGASGAWNQFTGSVETLAIKLGSALLPAFTKGANAGAKFINWLGGLGPKIKGAFSFGKEFLSGFIQPFKPALAIVAVAFMGLVGAVKLAAKALAPLGGFISKHSKAFGVAAGIITMVFMPALVSMGVAATVAKVKVVGAWLAKTAAAVKGAAMQSVSLVRLMPFYIQYAAVAVASAARTAASWVATQAAAVRGAAAQGVALAKVGASYVAMGAKAVATMAATVARTVAGWVLMGAQALLQAARMAAAWVIAMGPIGWAIAAVVGLAVVIYKNWDKIKAATIAVWGAISGFLKKAWNAIKGVVMGGVNAVINFVKSHWKTILMILTGPIGIAVGLIARNWDRIKGAFSSAVNFVKGVVSKGFGFIKSAITTYVNAWKAVITAVWNGIKAVVSGAVNFVKNVIRGWAFIAGFIGGLFQKAKTLASNALTGLVGFIKGIPAKVTAVFSNAGSWLLNAGKDIIQGLLDGIGNMIGAVRDKLSVLTDMIPDWKGPRSKDRKLLRTAGQDIIKGLVKAFGDSFGDVKKKLRELTNFIQKNMEGKGEKRWLKRIQATNDKAKKLWDRRVELAKARDAALEKLDDLRSAKGDFLQSVKEGMTGQANVTNAGNTAAVIAQSLTDQVAKVKRFADMLQKLRSLGFSDAVVMQVASAGVEGGWQAATALEAATGGQVRSINASMAAITTTAGDAAAKLAGQMYDAGIQAAEGVVQGLKVKANAIANALKSIGQNMARDIAQAVSRMAARMAAQAKREAARKAREEGKGKGLDGPGGGGRGGRGRGPRGPSARALSGGQHPGGGTTFNFHTHNPVAEPQSRTTNKALDRAGSLGLV